MPIYVSMPARSFVGSVVGYCIGEFIKKFSKKLAIWFGAGFMFLGVLSYNNWIKINWRKIDKDLVSILFRGTRTATGFIAYFSRLFTHVIPMMGGFYLGFRYSLKDTLPLW